MIEQPVIFLDFDGVLLTLAMRYAWADPLCVAALNRLVAATGAGIVVSSGHRSTLLSARILLAGWRIRAAVLGVTPRCGGGRSREIQAWLDEHPVQRFVILDDITNLWHLAPYHVSTDPFIGLTEEDADRAIEILQAGPWAPSAPPTESGREA